MQNARMAVKLFILMYHPTLRVLSVVLVALSVTPDFLSVAMVTLFVTPDFLSVALLTSSVTSDFLSFALLTSSVASTALSVVAILLSVTLRTILHFASSICHYHQSNTYLHTTYKNCSKPELHSSLSTV